MKSNNENNTNEQNIKIIISFVLFLIILLAFTSNNTEIVKIGIRMVINGECYHVNNYMWRTIGLENPVCRIAENMEKVTLNALKGDPISIATITTLITTIISVPKKINNSLNYMANKITNMIHYNEIENPPINP